jgi:catechol 2,3-dioxygenase-like lactoylglutathione lyase family enzyme
MVHHEVSDEGNTMIFGMHTIVFTQDAQADRAFFRDVLSMESVDSGGGWLIFALPPGELAFHPTDGANVNELYLLCDDLAEEMDRLGAKGVAFSDVDEERWGNVTRFTLPGGSVVGLYQPKHPMALRRN